MTSFLWWHTEYVTENNLFYFQVPPFNPGCVPGLALNGINWNQKANDKNKQSLAKQKETRIALNATRMAAIKNLHIEIRS